MQDGPSKGCAQSKVHGTHFHLAVTTLEVNLPGFRAGQSPEFVFGGPCLFFMHPSVSSTLLPARHMVGMPRYVLREFMNEKCPGDGRF